MEIMQTALLRPYWDALVAYLKKAGDARWVLDDQDRPKDLALIFLAGIMDGEVVGVLTLLRQPIISPWSDWVGERDRTLRDETGKSLAETFVQTFRVAEAFRRQGVGRGLQEAALQVTKQLGCIQMRSWSSLDAEANYRLKFGLGFGYHPAIQEMPGGLKVSGGYFVKRVD